MDFGLSEEQKILRESVRSFMVEKCPKSYVRNMEKDEKGYSEQVWQEMGGLGWMGLAFPEKYGGGGMSFLDLALLLEEMGRACMPGPFFSTVVLGGLTLVALASEERKREILPKIAQGKHIVTLALTEPDDTYGPDGIRTRAVADGKDYVINGTKILVPDFNVADHVICVARTKEGAGENGITLFLVDAGSPGISCTMLRSMSSHMLAEVVFRDVRVSRDDMLGGLDKGWSEVERIMDRGAIAKCAEMVGGSQQVLEMAVQYAKDRIQFDHPIGSFQAIQHHCANMATDVECSRLVTYEAAWMLSEGLPCAGQISMAKAWVSDAYRRVVWLGHQIHGAIGFTIDHDLPLYFKRQKAAELAFGDADFHRERLAVEVGL